MRWDDIIGPWTSIAKGQRRHLQAHVHAAHHDDVSGRARRPRPALARTAPAARRDGRPAAAGHRRGPSGVQRPDDRAPRPEPRGPVHGRLPGQCRRPGSERPGGRGPRSRGLQRRPPPQRPAGRAGLHVPRALRGRLPALVPGRPHRHPPAAPRVLRGVRPRGAPAGPPAESGAPHRARRQWWAPVPPGWQSPTTWCRWATA